MAWLEPEEAVTPDELPLPELVPESEEVEWEAEVVEAEVVEAEVVEPEAEDVDPEPEAVDPESEEVVRSEPDPEEEVEPFELEL